MSKKQVVLVHVNNMPILVDGPRKFLLTCKHDVETALDTVDAEIVEDRGKKYFLKGLLTEKLKILKQKC